MKNNQEIIADYCLAEGPSDVLRYLPRGLTTQAAGSNLDFFIRANLKVEELFNKNKNELQDYSSYIPVFKEMRQTLFLTFACLGQSKANQMATQAALLEKWKKLPDSLEKMAQVFTASAEVYTARADALENPPAFQKDDLAAHRFATQIQMSSADKKNLNIAWEVTQSILGEAADGRVGGLFFLEETAYRCKKISAALKDKAVELQALLGAPNPSPDTLLKLKKNPRKTPTF